ncbi:hypothetical protein JMJ35_005391 [Cladonia borealis]|uniref:Hikeshi-like domain-containing protein n=1 Tax=Cladonia borealis TaxID=184061 RepID=A0AA39V1H0_9LECA|nr:hypothetical protein JMJ35_005391 [Cladonia borealis]
MSTTPPFGLLLPSRPVLVNPAVISPSQYAFTLPSMPTFSHIVVFLLPGTTLPEGTLAGVYVLLPGTPAFKFLGAIGTEKQSAIFRVSGGGSVGSGGDAVRVDDMMDADETSTTNNGTAVDGDVTVGISIEPASTIALQLESLKTTESSSSTALVPVKGHLQTAPISTKVLAQRIIKNAFNFLASFAGTTGAGGQEVIPLKSFQDWWSKFERRIENDPGWLEREADS